MTEKLIVEKKGPVGWIVFNQPGKRNAVSVDMWEALPGILERYAADPEVRVLALKGAGDKAFVSGADISQFEKQRSGPEAVQYYEEIAERAQIMLHGYAKPTVAVLRGYTLGAGVNIALCCDLRIAADDAKIGIPAARMGLGYRTSATKNLVDIVGPARAREMLITAAHRQRLVNRVVPVAELEAAAEELLATIGANAPLTMACAKHIVLEVLKSPREFDAAGCTAMVKKCFESQDYQEGRRAFMEKRKPAFQGK
jgi:enoyl-CoA hydratase/carnithine racemase